MSDTIRRPRTETYDNTVSGWLTKRADLFNEVVRIRDRLADIKNELSPMYDASTMLRSQSLA